MRDGERRRRWAQDTWRATTAVAHAWDWAPAGRRHRGEPCLRDDGRAGYVDDLDD